MISRRPAKPMMRAATLMEAVIAVGVLALAIPLVFASLAQAGKGGVSAGAETRCAWMVPACMDEIRASRAGVPQYFTPTLAGQVFPPSGEVWVLAFSPEGRTIGKVAKSQFEGGLKELGGEPVLYLGEMSAAKAPERTGIPTMMDVRITIAYPARAPSDKRQKLDFHTRIP